MVTDCSLGAIVTGFELEAMWLDRRPNGLRQSWRSVTSSDQPTSTNMEEGAETAEVGAYLDGFWVLGIPSALLCCSIVARLYSVLVSTRPATSPSVKPMSPNKDAVKRHFHFCADISFFSCPRRCKAFPQSQPPVRSLTMADSELIAYSIASFVCALFVLEFGADKFIDHTVVVARLTGIPQTLIALLTAGAEWEEVISRGVPVQWPGKLT